MTATGPSPSSPTGRLLVGLAVTLSAVAIFSLYTFHQIEGLKKLQTDIVDRNRRDSLQLLRIQNDLHALGLAMRDMLDSDEPYTLDAYSVQLGRIRSDLEDALRTESRLAPTQRTPDQQQYIATYMSQMWDSTDRMLALARNGETERARDLIRTSLQARQASLTTAIARLLTQNHEAEEEAVAEIRAIYATVERNVLFFLGAMLLAVSLTSVYVIYSNRRIFASLELLSDHRSALARKLISMQEEVLSSVSRELHDEFGQILTAIGSMLRRAEKHGGEAALRMRDELLETREVAQETLEKVRSLSQALHPSVLDDGGIEGAIDWYVPVFQKQTGIRVHYDKQGVSPIIPGRIAIHAYRVLQEALNNVARHSKAAEAWVRVAFAPERFHLEIEDHGIGLPGHGADGRKGIGMLAMRERARLAGGAIEIGRPGEGGTLVRFSVPLEGNQDGE